MKASSSSGQIPWIIVKGTVILLVFVFLMAIYPQPAQAACSFKYTVQSGDSLYGIAATYQVAFEDLVELNKLIEPYVIYVGQVLCMPPGAVKPTTTTVAGTTTLPVQQMTCSSQVFTWGTFCGLASVISLRNASIM